MITGFFSASASSHIAVHLAGAEPAGLAMLSESERIAGGPGSASETDDDENDFEKARAV